MYRYYYVTIENTYNDETDEFEQSKKISVSVIARNEKDASEEVKRISKCPLIRLERIEELLWI